MMRSSLPSGIRRALAGAVCTAVLLMLTPSASQSAASTACDDTLWTHVYNPSRLEKLDACITAKGIVEESSVDADGDQHFLLRLDAGQSSLVNKRNVKKKNGDLVVEIVCANRTTMKKARKACKGYTNRIPLPVVGSHVAVTGTFVLDSHNGWNEIHPVSKVARL